MISNNNRPVINKIANRIFQSNKNRNFIAIIAIVLTTVLFTTIFTMGFELLNTVKQENIRKAGGDGQVVLSNITDEVYEDVKDNPRIDKIAYTKLAADEILEERLNGLRSEMWYMDNTAIEFAGYKLEDGHLPETEQEIITDSKLLEELGIEKKIGTSIQLNYRVKDQLKTQEFILAGYWNEDEFSNVHRIIVSKDYLNANKNDIPYTYDTDMNYSGIVTVYINFKDDRKLSEQITEMLKESGYVWEGMGADKDASNFVIARISPAYLFAATLDNPNVIVGLIGVILLIFVAGYLIIYNIFQISVMQDIRFFGQLKTLGTTEKQLKRLLQKQVNRLAAIGIPIGLALGYFLGVLLVPALMQSTAYNAADHVHITAIPIIFLGAAFFSFITIYISVSIPRKAAAKVSPLEALRFVDRKSKKLKKEKQSLNGGKIYRMAIANLGRNKKRTLLVIFSLALAAVLLNSVFTLVNGFDEEAYVNNFLDKDFIISTTEYFQYQFGKSEHRIPQSYIDYVKSQPEFGEGGRLIGTQVLEEQFSAESDLLPSPNRDMNGYPMINLYGADDYLLQSMDLLEGVLDFDKLKAGSGIIIGIPDNGFGNAEVNIPIQVGDKIKIHFYDVTDEINLQETDVREFEVIAKVLIKENTYTDRHTGNTNVYIPSEVFFEYIKNPITVSYIFNCKEGEKNIQQMQEKLEYYVKSNSLLNFDSKKKYLDEFSGIENTFVIIGSALGGIIAFIGIVNFFNAMFTSILTRKGEFAMLQSVGMTDQQLKSMLITEGLVYAAATILLSILFGIIVSLSIVKVVSCSIWFFTFRFTLLPIMALSPIFIFIAIMVPYFLCRGLEKESIIVRLRTE